MADDEILAIREDGGLQKIGEKTAYTMAQSGELPRSVVRGQWRFRRTDIDQWIAQQVGRVVDQVGSEEEGERP